eukprot:EG_transcript_40228
MNVKLLDESLKGFRELYSSAVGKAEEPLKAFHAKPCDEYIVYVTRSRPLAERHCVVISGKDADPTLRDVLVASRRAFNDPRLNELVDWGGFVLPLTVPLARIHTDGVIHNLLVRHNKALEAPTDAPAAWAVVGLAGAALASVAAVWWVRRQRAAA